MTRQDVERAVADLFTSGAGRKATRLMLVNDAYKPGERGHDLGGWCEAAMVDRLCLLLGIERGTANLVRRVGDRP